MINMQNVMNTNQVQWTPTIDQDGNEITQAMVQNETLTFYKRELESKRANFEKALKERCERDNEVYNNMGYEPSVGEIIYQVGMRVFTLKVNTDGIHPVQIGEIR